MSYNLHCFNCGVKFISKEDVVRNDGKPYCGDCASSWEYYGSDDLYDEEEHRKQVYLAKYGVY